MTDTMTNSRCISLLLGNLGGLTKVSRGTPALYQLKPTIYASKDETTLGRAVEILAGNAYALLLRETKVIAPNFYGVTYAHASDGLAGWHAFELRLVRHTNSPIPLALVSTHPDGSVEYFDDCRSVYDTESSAAYEVMTAFVSAHPDRRYFWLPRFALPRSRQV